MTRTAFRIAIERAKPLGARQELALLREAYARRPDAPLLRLKLASALIEQDAFDTVIALFDEDVPQNHGESAVLVQALFARGTLTDTHRAVGVLENLPVGPSHAQVLADQAKAYRRLGQRDVAHDRLVRALALAPANLDACMRMAAMHLEADDPDAAIAMLDALADAGVSHGYAFAARARALACAGRIEEARIATGFDAFHHAGTIDTPPGFTRAGFDAALARALLDHPEQRFGRYGTASEQTWRIDKPAVGNVPLVDLLLDTIVRAAERHVAAIADSDHPWVRARPDAGLLNCWCVITDGAGYESWHIHPSAWLSGVYYVQVPRGITNGTDAGGCIAFGLSDEEVGAQAAAAYGVQLVRPETGMLMLFPSHSYHRTFPHGTSERRICLAFDICAA